MQTTLSHHHLSDFQENKEQGACIRMLNEFSVYRIKNPVLIKKYHDLLLFHCAFPYNKTILRLATDELFRISQEVSNMTSRKNSRIKKTFEGSGFVQTEIICSFSSPITRWLTKTFPDDVDLYSCDAEISDIRNIIQHLLPAIEFYNSTDGELRLAARLKKLSGLTDLSAQLKWILLFFEEALLPEATKELFYQQLKIYSRWKLNVPFYSRTFLRWPVDQLYFQQNFIKTVDSSAIVKQKTGKPLSLTAAKKLDLISTMSAALAFLYRETDPVTFADITSPELFEMGRGMQIALVSMKMENRLALESYIGFMAFKNGVPVAYGGAWIWGRSCKIGVNILPAFRRGESAWLFCQVMRVYYQQYEVRHFFVKPYQFGKGNPEGIKSGAFWFYYKLGFRPTEKKIQLEAAAEWQKILDNKNYRTPAKLLKHFTSCNKEWITGKYPLPEIPALLLSKAISKMINQQFNHSRKKAIASCLLKLKKELPVSKLKIKTAAQKRMLENWSLLLGLLNNLPGWSVEQKKSFVQVLTDKISGNEKDFTLKLQKHRQFWISLQKAFE